MESSRTESQNNFISTQERKTMDNLYEDSHDNNYYYYDLTKTNLSKKKITKHWKPKELQFGVFWTQLKCNSVIFVNFHTCTPTQKGFVLFLFFICFFGRGVNWSTLSYQSVRKFQNIRKSPMTPGTVKKKCCYLLFRKRGSRRREYSLEKIFMACHKHHKLHKIDLLAKLFFQTFENVFITVWKIELTILLSWGEITEAVKRKRKMTLDCEMPSWPACHYAGLLLSLRRHSKNQLHYFFPDYFSGNTRFRK